MVFLFVSGNAFSQAKIKDSLYVSLYKLAPEKYSYAIHNGKINVVNVNIKNKYGSQMGYVTGYYSSRLSQIKKESKHRIISYEKLNDMINADYLNVQNNYHLFFILTEDKYNYLTIQLRPISPGRFNIE